MAWVGWQLDMEGDQVKVIQTKLYAKYDWVKNRYPSLKAASGKYDKATQAAVVEFQFRTGLPVTGIADFATQLRLGSAVSAPPPKPKPRILLLTFSGTSADMWSGFPADLARALDPAIYYWQPVNYGPNGIPAVFPMGSSVKSGEVEGVRLLDEKADEYDFIVLVGYSQGAIVASRLKRRIQSGDLQRFKSKLIAGVTFGNPLREAGHTFPGGTDPGGYGLDPELLTNTEDWWHDYAAPGDIYTCASGTSDQRTNSDMTLIYELVQGDILKLIFGSDSSPLDILLTLSSGLLGGFKLPAAILLPGLGEGPAGALSTRQRGLVEAVIALFTNPFAEVPAMVKAIVSGIGFVAQSPPTAPHIEYHIREAVPGVTYLQHAINHLNFVGAGIKR
ncbi:hypothetical protein B5566_02385 [Mycobacterium sp. MHSD3]|nr:hypothetical protein B5566_02385 [Mycobacterium sp. MHSD3]